MDQYGSRMVLECFILELGDIKYIPQTNIIFQDINRYPMMIPYIDIPSGKLSHNYGNSPFIVDLPIEKNDSP